jgi:uncharacterized protein YkwD
VPGFRHGDDYRHRQSHSLAPDPRGAGLSHGAGTAFAGSCPNADSGINDAMAAELANALRCLINEDRAQRDARRLDSNSKLREAAARHNKTMFEENCWSHDCPGEPRLERRIRNTGYLDGARRWSFAEVFGCANTPQGMLNGWLNRNYSRNSLRKRAFRDIGVAAVRDQVPRSDCNGDTQITFTAVLAERSG